MCEGDHNSQRPQFLVNSISFFLNRVLQIEDSASIAAAIDPSVCTVGLLPWSTGTSYIRNLGFDHAALDDQILQSVLLASLSTRNEKPSTISAAAPPLTHIAPASGASSTYASTLIGVGSNLEAPWSCGSCTFYNDGCVMSCNVCGAARTRSVNLNVDVYHALMFYS